MNTRTARTAIAVPGSEGFSAFGYADTDEMGLVRFVLPSGGGIPQHEIPFEVCFMVLSGSGVLQCSKDRVELESGSVAICPAHMSRSWINPWEVPLEVLVLKFKRRTSTEGDTVIARRISEQPPAKNPHGVDVRRVYDSQQALSSVVTLKPGEKLIRHITPVDVFFYVLEGRGHVEVGDERVLVTKDTVIESPKDIPHCWYNEGTETLRFLVVKVPKPTSKTILL